MEHGQAEGVVSHERWGDFLRPYLSERDGVVLFNYGGVSAEDKAVLDGYVLEMSEAPVLSFSRNEQFVYWINLYNALTIQLVIDHYPVSSIKKIYSKFLATGPWRKKLVVIEGEEVSLDDIEHRILRPLWKDPRVHYAINCASIGCPNLTTAYTVDNVEALLDSSASSYINHPRGVDVRRGKLRVSSIFKWFKEDFGGSDQGVIAHIKKYAASQLLARMDGLTEISESHYDWKLNDAK